MGLGDQGCFKEFDCVDVLVDVLEIYVQEVLLQSLFSEINKINRKIKIKLC